MNITDSINKNLAARISQDIAYMNTREKMGIRITADEMVIKVPRDTYKQLLELSLEHLRYLNKKALSEHFLEANYENEQLKHELEQCQRKYSELAQSIQQHIINAKIGKK